MSTSGITSVQYTRDQLITAALRKLSVIAEGQTPSAQNLTDGAMALNSLLAYLRKLKIPMWARKNYSFTPTNGTQTYQIGTGYTLNTPYPLHILQALRQDSSSTNKIDMQVVPAYNFNMFPVSLGGMPIQLTYQPYVNYGEIKLWPVPDATATSTTITIVYVRPFEIFNSGTDTMDMPEEYYMPVIYQLAKALAPEWGIPLQDRQLLASEAKEYLEGVLEIAEEDGSLFFQPARR